MPEILIGIAIDVVVNQQSSFVASLGFDSARSQILVLAVLTFFIWAGESLFEYFHLILWRNLSQRLQAEMRQDAYDKVCLLYTSPSPRDLSTSRMPSSA